MTDCPFIRYAIVNGARDRAQLEAYLPSGYSVIHAYEEERPRHRDAPLMLDACFVIAGRDNAGWTLHGYVQPRLASGLIGCTEIGLDHPILKEVPA